MNLDDLKRAWQGEGVASRPADAEILALVRRQATEFDRQIRRRDRREIVVAAVLAIFFSPLLLGPSPITRAGVLLFLGATVLIYWKLRGARKDRMPADSAESVAAVLHAERAKIVAQIRLLESVIWWYLLPLGVGIVLIFAGQAGFGWMTLAYTVAVLVFCGWVYRLNQRVVRDELRPRERELTHLLEQISE